MVVTWNLPNPIAGGFWLDNPSRSGGVAFNGGEQVVVSMAMRWRAKWTIPIRTKEEVLAARVFADGAQGKAVAILVPVFDGLRANWPVDFMGTVLSPRVVRRMDLEGTAYEDDEIPAASQITASLLADIEDRDTTCYIDLDQGSVPLPGQYFGLGGRVYRINAVEESESPAGYELTFLPPSRGGLGHTAGSTVQFTRPVCLMRQMADDQGIKDLDMLRRAELQMEFIEDI